MRKQTIEKAFVVLRKESVKRDFIKTVYLFNDEFVNYLDTQIGIDAIQLLEGLNYEVKILRNIHNNYISKETYYKPTIVENLSNFFLGFNIPIMKKKKERKYINKMALDYTFKFVSMQGVSIPKHILDNIFDFLFLGLTCCISICL